MDSAPKNSALAKAEEPQALALKPLEWLKLADQVFTESMAKMSAALIQDCDEHETMMIHNWVKKAAESTKMFQDNARARLMNFLIRNGSVVTDKGTLQIEANGWRQRAVPINTKPNDKLTEQMLRLKGFDINEYMDKTIKYSANSHKLKWLHEEQKITDSEYKSCFGETAYRIGAAEPIVETDDEYVEGEDDGGISG